MKNRTSVVSDRFAFLFGKRVAVRTEWQPHTTFVATLVGVIPAGRDYVYQFTDEGRARVVNTRSVLEIVEAN